MTVLAAGQGSGVPSDDSSSHPPRKRAILGAMELGPEYARSDDPDFHARYRAACHCAAVRYEVSADPLDAKLCHCRDCRVLHGAPFQWAAIFEKRHVRILSGTDALRSYGAQSRGERASPPRKLACARCGTWVADEGRRMWLAFPELFDFGEPPQVPVAFRPTCHIFYASRVLDIQDDLPKWSGHKKRSTRLPGSSRLTRSAPR